MDRKPLKKLLNCQVSRLKGCRFVNAFKGFPIFLQGLFKGNIQGKIGRYTPLKAFQDYVYLLKGFNSWS